MLDIAEVRLAASLTLDILDDAIEAFEDAMLGIDDPDGAVAAELNVEN